MFKKGKETKKENKNAKSLGAITNTSAFSKKKGRIATAISKINLSNKQKVVLSVFVVFVIIAIIIAGLINYNIQKANFAKANPELARAMEYDQVKDGEENVDGTDGHVKFDAFFLRDLDGDGYAESIRGTSKQIGDEDTLYMELNVQTAGYLKDAKITLNDGNYYFQTTLPKDKDLKNSYIGNNIRKIEFNQLNSGTQKMIIGVVRSGDYAYSSSKDSAIGNNVNNYSKLNSITFTGTYVPEEGEPVEVTKTVNFNIDWYGETKATISNTSTTYRDLDDRIDEENGTISLDFSIGTSETKNELMLKDNHVEAQIPQLNGYDPISVEYTGSNAISNYNASTRTLTIDREAKVEEDGTVITGLSNSNSYNIKVIYPLEAYQSVGGDTVQIKIPVSTYYEGYNNSSEEFENPYKSNIASTTLTATYKHVEVVEEPVEPVEPSKPPVYPANSSVTIGKYTSSPTSRYVVSKLKPLKIYNGVSEDEQDDTYQIEWYAYTGTNGATNGLVLKETQNREAQKVDNFIKTDSNKESMEDVTTNIGIAFSGASDVLKDDGWIKVYDEDTGNLLETFTKDNWSRYTSSNPYKYDLPVKHIRVETSETNADARLYVYNIKKLDDEYITTNYTKEEFDNLQYIETNLAVYLGGNLIGTKTHKANYEVPYSVADIGISKNTISTQITEKNEKITITARYNSLANQAGWVDGSFLVKLPEGILTAKINSVQINNNDVSITSYEVVEQDGVNLIKINTENKNDTPQTYSITVDVDITPNPVAATTNGNIELYAANGEICDYYYKASDIYDVNNNLNTEEQVNHDTTSFSMISPSSLLTNQIGSNYDDKGSTIVSPQVADVRPAYGVVDKEHEKEATIGVQVTNNYGNRISEIQILGKIPFKGNTYVLSGGDLGSTFTTRMTEAGITVPEKLQQYVTVYYSENENPDRDLSKSENGWKTADEITNWDNIKTYLIDFGDYVMPTGENYSFNYTVKIPNGVEFNQEAYSHHGVYFSLETEQGKYRTQVEPNKLGFRIAEKYNLELIKYQTGKEKVIPGATYSITDEVSGEIKTAVTNTDGTLTIKNLYAGKAYLIKEIKTPSDYELNSDVIRFIGHVDENGNLTIEKTQGNTREDMQVIKNEGEDYKATVKVEDEVKASIKIHKTEQGTGTPIQTVKYKLTGYGLPENGRFVITNGNGEVTINGLSVNQEYTLEELKAEGYYLADPITFKIINENGNYSIQTTAGTIAGQSTEEKDSIPTVTINLEDEKTPRYSLQIIKVKKTLDTTLTENEEEVKDEIPQETPELTYLAGAKFKLYKGTKEIGEYITDETGTVTIDDLYQYIEGKVEDATYTLKEVLAPEGYVKVKDITFKVDGTDGSLKLINEDGTEEKYTVEENTVKLTIEDSPSFKLIKKDAETGNTLANIKFAIYNVENGDVPATNSKGEIIGTKETINGKEYYTVQTNEAGELTADLPEGLYKAVEVQAPEKYDLEGQVYYFGIGASRETEEGLVATWEESFGGDRNENITSVAETSDGGYIVGGYFASSSIQVGNETITNNNYDSYYKYTDALIIKYSSEGEVEWAKSIGGSSSDYIQSVAATSDGGFIVGGYFGSSTIQVGNETITNTRSGYYDGLIIKYSSEGEIEWAKSIDGDDDDYIQSVAATSDGGYIVGGYFSSRAIQVGNETLVNNSDQYFVSGQMYYNYYIDGLIIKYSSEGEVEYAKVFGGNSKDYIYSVAETKDGRYIAVGCFASESIQVGNKTLTNNNYDSYYKYTDALIIKFQKQEKANHLVFTNATSVGGSDDEQITSVASTSDGGYIVGGYFSSRTIQVGNETLTSNGSYDGLIIKYNREGSVEWAKSFGGDDNDYIESVAETKDGGYIAGGSFGVSITVGNETLTGKGQEGLIIKYNKEGEVEWAKSIGGSSRDYIQSVAATKDGGYIAGGSFGVSITVGNETLTGKGQEGLIIKYNKEGEVEWAKSFGGSKNDYIQSVAATKDGGYIAGGYFSSSTIQVGEETLTNKGYDDGIIIKYNKEGVVEWAKSIGGGSSSDYIQSVASTSDGGIIAGGSFYSSIQVGEETLTGEGQDGLIIKYNKEGVVEWAKSIGGGYGSDYIQSVAATKDGGIIAGGYFDSGTFHLGEESLVNNSNRDDDVSFSDDGIIIKYNSEGQIEWAKSIGGSSDDQITSVAEKEDGKIVAGGYFESETIEIDGHTLTNKSESSGYSGITDGMILEVVNQVVVPEVQELTVENSRKEFKITTDVKEIDGEKGGSISGEDLKPYETVKYGDSNTKDIVMTPDENYEILGITVNGEEWPFTANTDGTYTIPKQTFENMTEDKHIEVTYALKTNKITINKEDSKTGTKLPGATFEIKSEDGKTTIKVSTNSKGQAITQLKYGKYTITEIEAPEGYELNSTPLEIEFNENGEHEFTIKDNKLAQVIVHHYLKDKNGEYTTTKVAEDELQEGKTGENYTTSPKLDLEKYELEKDEKGEYVIPTNATGEFTEKTIEVKYYYESKKIPLTVHHYIEGTTTSVPLKNGETAQDIKESGEEGEKYTTSPIEDSLLSDDYELVERPTNATGTYTSPEVVVTYYYRRVSRQVVINKLAEDGKTPLQGATFKIQSKEVANKIEQSAEVGGLTSSGDYYFELSNGKLISNNQGEDSTTANSYIKIDLTGKPDATLKINAEISSQSYDYGYAIVNQVTSNPSYSTTTGRIFRISGQVDAKDYETTLTGGKVYYLHLGYYKNYSTSSYDDTFTINGITINDIDILGLEATTNSKGQITTNLESGDYVATEISVPEGYQLPANPKTEFSVTKADDVVTLNITNTKVKGTVITHYYIEGTTDKVPLQNGGVAEDVIYTGNVGDIYATKGAEDIPVEYELVRTEGETSGTIENGTKEVIYYYRLKNSNLTIVKTNEQGEGLEGAEFKIENKENGKVNYATTGAEGKVTVQVPVGESIITETKAPRGYKLNKEPVNIKIELDKENVVTIQNKAINYYTLELSKIDAETKELISGVEFNLTYADHYGENHDNTYTTDLNGKITLENLEDEIVYTLKETKTPKGYVKDTEEKQFVVHYVDGAYQIEILKGILSNIKTENNTIKVNIENKPSLKIVKQDNHGQPIQGVKFTITDEQGQEVTDGFGNTVGTIENIDGKMLRVLTTDANGVITENLVPGKYVITEVQAPWQYALPEDENERKQTIEITSEGFEASYVEQAGITQIDTNNLQELMQNMEPSDALNIFNQEITAEGKIALTLSLSKDVTIPGKYTVSGQDINLKLVGLGNAVNMILTQDGKVEKAVLIKADENSLIITSNILSMLNGDYITLGVYMGTIRIPAEDTVNNQELTLSTTGFNISPFIARYNSEGKIESLKDITYLGIDLLYDYTSIYLKDLNGKIEFFYPYEGQTLTIPGSETSQGKEITVNNETESLVVILDDELKVTNAFANPMGVYVGKPPYVEVLSTGGMLQGIQNDEEGGLVIPGEQTVSGEQITLNNYGDGILVTLTAEGKIEWAKPLGSQAGMYLNVTEVSDGYLTIAYYMGNLVIPAEETKNGEEIRVENSADTIKFSLIKYTTEGKVEWVTDAGIDMNDLEDMMNIQIRESKNGYAIIMNNGKVISFERKYSEPIVKEQAVVTIQNTISKGSLVVHHYKEGTTESLSDDETSIGDIGTPYETHPANDIPVNYELVETPSNANGNYAEEETTVTYYYRLKTPNITNQKIQKTGTEKIESLDQEITYNIKYTAELLDYTGNVTVKLVDTLPYPLDTTKTNIEEDLAGGRYDEATKTITWEEQVNDIKATEVKEINVEKTITVVYKDVDKDAIAIDNKVSAHLEYSTNQEPSEDINANWTTTTGFIINIPVSKVWDDSDNKLEQRPTRVVFKLSGSDGSERTLEISKPGTEGSTTTQDSNNPNKWNDIFKNLPKYDSSNNEITYTLTEEQKTEGDLKYYETSIDNDSKTVTNTNKYGKVTVHHYVMNPDGSTTETRVPDVNNTEIPDEIIEGKEGDPYETEPADNVSDKYELVQEKLPEKPNGTIEKYNEEKPQEVIYYYRLKPAKVIIHYLEKDGDSDDSNNLVLSDNEQIDGHVDDQYNTDTEHKKDKIEKDGKTYTLVSNSGNTQGTMTVADTNVTYYYLQNTKATVRYVERDPETHEIVKDLVAPRTEEGLVGDNFVTNSKEFPGYKLVESPVQTTIKMTKDEQTLIYYYEPIKTGLLENHIDDKTGKILYTEQHNVQVGQDYNIPPKNFDGYDRVTAKDPINASGTMGEETVVVNYYYIKKAVLEVNYIDKNTGEPLTDQIVDDTKHEGDSYKTEKKTFEDYDLVEVPSNAEGTLEVETDEYGNITNNKTVVTYYYAKKSAGVEEHHIDIQTGEELEPPTMHEGHVGDPYDIKSKDFLSYAVAVTDKDGNNVLPTNAQGTMTEEKQVVTYYYYQPAKVIVHYVDRTTGKEIEETNPETGELQNSQVVINGAKDDDYTTTAKDFEYYKLVESPEESNGKMRVEITKDENGKDIVNNTIDVYYYYEPKPFNIGVEKDISAIIVNGNRRNATNGKLEKVDIYRKSTENTSVQVEYKIKVMNTGEISGRAIVEDKLPEGMSLANNDGTWEVSTGEGGANASTTIRKVIPEIGAGETKEYTVLLNWKTSGNNMGNKVNEVTLTETDNVPGFKDGNDKDNKDNATVSISVETGEFPVGLLVALVALVGLESVTLRYAVVLTKRQKKNNKR